ncbi:MAG: MBOAT family protein [Lachnospiraceae bacterium]|nr:MBOAT family protein [Lachnospiraceae bacterium]
MVFSSVIFLFILLPITLLGYFILNKISRGCGNYWLLLISLLFFSWSQPNYLWIILANIVINYIGALLVDKLKKGRTLALIISIAMNLLMLFYFKYFDFAIDTYNNIFNKTHSLRNIVLPIGISFFTFQGMSYVIDVYRKDVEVQKNPFKVALYITLFPQLIAGPIVRYKSVAREIEDRNTSLLDFSAGLERFIIGLSKKTLIANTMAELADQAWNSTGYDHLAGVAWIVSIAYTLQIYFDFSGYSDMAIGLGRMFGFHFDENFDLPYISESITEFWRRWHISLSSWFRDYVYIPLGGNRKRVYLNLAIVFLLTGVWHGASWHFILWGVWNGFFILLERFIRSKKDKEKSASVTPLKRILMKVYTLLVVNFGWVLFRANNTKEALSFIRCMFGGANKDLVGFKLFWYVDRFNILIMIVGIFFASSIPRRIGKLIKSKVNENVVDVIKYVVILLLCYISMIRIIAGTYNPFIYFQF